MSAVCWVVKLEVAYRPAKEVWVGGCVVVGGAMARTGAGAGDAGAGSWAVFGARLGWVVAANAAWR